jgi:hypothetical protein
MKDARGVKKRNVPATRDHHDVRGFCEHGAAGELINDCTTCCASTCRAQRRGGMLGGVLYLKRYHLKRAPPSCDTERKGCAPERRVPEERHGRKHCGIEMCLDGTTAHASGRFFACCALWRYDISGGRFFVLHKQRQTSRPTQQRTGEEPLRRVTQQPNIHRREVKSEVVSVMWCKNSVNAEQV